MDMTELFLYFFCYEGVAGDRNEKKHEKSRFWVRDICLERKQYGKYIRLIQELKTVYREFVLDVVLRFLY